MSEEKKLGIARVLQIGIPIISATIALIALLLGIAARKKEITCTYKGSIQLVSVEPSQIHPDVKVEFRGLPVQSLTKQVYLLRNTGSAAVKGEDVRKPLRLQFQGTPKVIAAHIDRSNPAGFDISASVDEKSNGVDILFPLLNPNDEAEVSVFVLGTDTPRPHFEGRVVDVPQLVFVDGATNPSQVGPQFPRSHAVRQVLRWSLTLVFVGIALFLLGSWVGGIIGFFKYLPWKKRWGNAYDEVIKELQRERRESLPKPDETQEVDIAIAHEIMLTTGPRVSTLGLAKKLREKEIPPNPHPFLDSVGSVLGFGAFAVSLSCLLTFVGYVLFVSLK